MLFEAAVADRFPDNAVLSHDLIEGLFARAGLATDVEVVEEFPSRYDVARAREHRWTRGDWQLLPWLAGWSTRQRGMSKSAQRLSAVGRWKLFDNLRRSLTPIAIVATLIIGWFAPFEIAAIWTAFVVTAIVVPAFLSILTNLIVHDQNALWTSHIRALARDARLAIIQSGLFLVFAADKAFAMADAVVRTLYRLGVSRKHLLEWTTAAQAKSLSVASVGAYYECMAGGVMLATAALVSLIVFAAPGALVGLPILALWLLAPVIAKWVSFADVEPHSERLTDDNARSLRLIARQTWRFFDTFVTAGDKFLPPDNFQEHPRPVVAHRTSPTNIGLYLLSTVSAADFHWITIWQAAGRLEATFRTMSQLPRYRGHFFNWYATETGSPLEPRYVSAVDSGNLAAHLIAVAAACREWCDSANTTRPSVEGAADAFALLQQSLGNLLLPTTEHAAKVTSFSEALSEAQSQPTLGAAALSELLSLGAALHVSVAAAAPGSDAAYWAGVLVSGLQAQRDGQKGANLYALRQKLTAIAETADYMAQSMDFSFLVNERRQLLSIGFNVEAERLDESCYDLLASEARLASLVAIAKGDLPAKHWFRLGRTLLPVSGKATMVSWSGSMFEYLMPNLVTHSPWNSLLGSSVRSAVAEQIRYGKVRDIPWGVSESAYNSRDVELTYQYSNFGVPELGLKRGLADNVVIAPYATGLAAMISPNAATVNYEALEALGARGLFGFYEALDFTRSRIEAPAKFEVVKAYMAHHQGMTIVSLANTLLANVMQRRFHSQPIVQAAELLLQERAPRLLPAHVTRATLANQRSSDEHLRISAVRRIRDINAMPECHVLSNGRLSTVVSADGAGGCSWNGLAITRWQADPTTDDLGSFIYLRDAHTGALWSATHMPVCAEATSYEATFSEDRVVFYRQDGSLRTMLDVIVSPEDDAECRRVSVTNAGKQVRTLDVTSYSELVLASAASDRAHPAFSKLFVETFSDPTHRALLATRRRREPHEPDVWLGQVSSIEGMGADTLQFTTDRAGFIGRGRNLSAPLAVISGLPLDEKVGHVLDPIFAIRRRITVQPGQTVRVAFWTVAASARRDLEELVEKYSQPAAFLRTSTRAWTQALVELRHLGTDADEALLYQQLASRLGYPSPLMRASQASLVKGAVGLPALWAQGISGDVPILLVRIAEVEELGLVRQVLHAFEYWRNKRLEFDIVILNERPASYDQDLQNSLEALVRTIANRHRLAHGASRGSVFVLRSDIISAETAAAVLSYARVMLNARKGLLAEQLAIADNKRNEQAPPRRYAPAEIETQSADTAQLEFFNGYGGFRNNGQEYVTILHAGHNTPAPWINVVANEKLGFQISAEGSAFTWSINSRERKLTPWANDPVINRGGEAIYLRDEETNEIWSPTAFPIREYASPYTAIHGQGYSRFEHSARGIAASVDHFVAASDPVKIVRVRLTNTTSRRRRMSVTSYVEWVLAPTRDSSAAVVRTERDVETGAIFACNPWHTFFPERVAFSLIGGSVQSWTADRTEFLGRCGGIDNPAAMTSKPDLSRRAGVGFDPCAAMRTVVSLEPGAQADVVMLLGDAPDAHEARQIIKRQLAVAPDDTLADVAAAWRGMSDTLQVKTPDRSLDILVNQWLGYQTLACRYWARAGLYQCGGAFGYRDQLQDAMSLTMLKPDLARAHLVTAASRQFLEGDVQHWWLSPSGHGVRTRIADSALWLPYVCAHYIKTTGDAELLDETVAFLEGPQLTEDQTDVYFLPAVSDETGTMFEHCARALDRALETGPHGLALFGGGDWNDGMNRVGRLGRGESVWLSWFLITCLDAFAPIAVARNDASRAQRWQRHREALQMALERDAWSGEWYVRGYFDDGTPLGAPESRSCRIDAIAQSWSVISGAGDPERAHKALGAVQEHLVDEETGLALLFTPPFNNSTADPGYIGSYPPGVRENGGQYTHAAAWTIIALAMIGDGDGAAKLFSLINPINLTSTRAGARRYGVEPYVIAADVYSVAPHKGRGGWSWYTGSAGWLYRAAIEYILGFKREGDDLVLKPAIPAAWPGFELIYRADNTQYQIRVANPGGVSNGISACTVDGHAVAMTSANSVRIPMRSLRGHKIQIDVTMGEQTSDCGETPQKFGPALAHQ